MVDFSATGDAGYIYDRFRSYNSGSMGGQWRHIKLVVVAVRRLDNFERRNRMFEQVGCTDNGKSQLRKEDCFSS